MDPHNDHPQILLYEPDPDLREKVEDLLTASGYRCATAGHLEPALEAADTNAFALVLAEVGRGSAGVEGARVLKERAHPAPLGLLCKDVRLPPVPQDAGFAFSAVQPFVWEQLVSQVAEVLRRPLQAQDERAVALVERYFEALTNRNWSGLGELCTEDVVYALPAEGPYAQVIRGRDAFARFSEQTFAEFPKAKFHTVLVFALPEGLVARYTATWTSPGGEPVSQSGAVSFRFRGNAISEIGVRLNAHQLLNVEQSATR